MGEIADDMIDGTLDSVTGEYLGEGRGHPRSMMWNTPKRKKLGKTTDSKELNGVMKFLGGYVSTEQEANEVLRTYGTEVLKFRKDTLLRDIACAIQKDFRKFMKWNKKNTIRK